MDIAAEFRRIRLMFGSRPFLRRVAGIALAAILLPLLAAMPAGARTLSSEAGLHAHGDFCSAATDAAAAPVAPEPADHRTKVCAHCPGCTGCAGGPAAISAPVAPSLDIRPAGDVVVVAAPQPTHCVEVVTARPRGPPSRA